MSNVNRFERGEKAARRREKRQQEQSLTVMDDAPKKKKESEDLERDFDGEEIAAGVKKYIRADVPVLETSSKNQRRLVKKLKNDAGDRKMAARLASRAEVLQVEEAGILELENPAQRTYNVTQWELKDNVDLRTAQNSFNLNLDQMGPYHAVYTRTGRHLLLAGQKGHVALLEWKDKRLVSEFHTKERVFAATFLHNETWFALAQSKYVHIYDRQGIELHILRQHQKPEHVDYLPYHWLLVSSGSQGFIRWTDVSMGQLVAERNAHSGPITAMRQNPWNAIECCGHAQGSLSMWAPNMDKPIVKMLCHRGPVNSVAVDKGGHIMVTAGLDSFVNVWDVRTYKQLHAFRARGTSATVDVSARGMLAMGEDSCVSIWPAGALSEAVAKPYMRCNLPTRKDVVEGVRFCPWEDIIGVGHSRGFTSAIVPGAGEPNIDTLEANPFATKKQRREAEVYALLDKAPADTIMLDPSNLGQIQQVQVDKTKVDDWTDGSKKKLSKQAAEELRVRKAKLARLEEAEKQKKKKKQGGGGDGDDDDDDDDDDDEHVGGNAQSSRLPSRLGSSSALDRFQKGKTKKK